MKILKIFLLKVLFLWVILYLYILRKVGGNKGSATSGIELMQDFVHRKSQKIGF